MFKLELMFGGPPEQGGPVEVASFEAKFILDPSGDPSGPGEYTVWDIFWSILRIFTLWNKPSLRALKTVEN